MAEPPKLHLVQKPSRLQLVLEALSNNPYNWGTWEEVLAHRDWMLEQCQCPDIPQSDREGRMAQLKRDVDEAIRANSILRAQDFPHDTVSDLRKRIGIANVVDDFVDGEGEMSKLAMRNRERHFRALVDTFMRAGTVTHCEEVDRWLHDHGSVRPNNSDLTWLAVAEINADLIGAALPRVLVLPNFHHAYNPFFVYMDPSISVDAQTAGFLRLLFSR